MAQSSGAHCWLRQEWGETPPEISYRFVVGLEALRGAGAVLRVVPQKSSWWQRAIASARREISRFIVLAALVALFGWLSLQLGHAVYSKLDTSQYFGTGAVVPVTISLVAFMGLFAGSVIGMRLLETLKLQRLHRELYLNNEFLLEGRKSHLWIDEQVAGAIRRWSTLEEFVEFEEGIVLFLRRRTTSAPRKGILISKESRPGSCTWSELRDYLRQRLEEGAEAQTVSNP